MMIEKTVKLSVTFLKLRTEYMPQEQKNALHIDTTSFGELTTYNDIDYTGVEKNDPCPCGSGKKFKKCCRKAWEYPLTTLKPQKILFKPKLTFDEVCEFYELLNKLMVFVQNDYAEKNSKEKLSYLFLRGYDGSYAGREELLENGEMVNTIRHLKNNKELVMQFIDKYRDTLSDEELQTYTDWSNFIASDCIIMQTHNDDQVLAWDFRSKKIYFVYGLFDPLASIVPKIPFYNEMVLFPFKERLVFNGLLLGHDIEYGNNFLRGIVQAYTKDIEKNGIIFQI